MYKSKSWIEHVLTWCTISALRHIMNAIKKIWTRTRRRMAITTVWWIFHTIIKHSIISNPSTTCKQKIDQNKLLFDESLDSEYFNILINYQLHQSVYDAVDMLMSLGDINQAQIMLYQQLHSYLQAIIRQMFHSLRCIHHGNIAFYLLQIKFTKYYYLELKTN